jgi:REP element-mobilizing transposase RayT
MDDSDKTSLPERKQIRLQKYAYARCGAYFITICTYNRVHLWGEIVGATLRGRPHEPHKMVEKWLFKLEEKFENVTMDEYMIMPDHVHLILFLSGDHMGSPLPKIMEWFKTMTTNEYIQNVKNGKYPSFEKHIWQRSCFDHVIRNDEDLLEIRQYIQENPLRWEINRSEDSWHDADDAAIF